MQTVVVDYRPDARWTFGDSVRRIRLRSYLRLGRRWRASHWRLVSNERVPVWAKRLQLKIATRAFKVVLPYRIG